MNRQLSSGETYLNWDKLLQPKRLRQSRSNVHKLAKDSEFGFLIKDERNPFEKDFQRIILSASFRRLQDKTQVFPLDKSDFVRTRLTHSLEVASFAKAIGQLTMRFLRKKYATTPLQAGLSLPSREQAQAIEDILLSAGLLHDIGNPPFGHYGETTIRTWFKVNLPKLQYKQLPVSDWLNPQMLADLIQFEGNAQALRLLGKLHFLVDENGMNLTFPVLHTLIKYPVDSLHVLEPKLDVGRANPEANQAEVKSSNLALNLTNHEVKALPEATSSQTQPQELVADISRHKLGYFYAERDLFANITESLGTAWRLDAANLTAFDDYVSGNAGNQLSYACPSNAPYTACRHPLSYLLEAADDIAYRSADIEDALRKSKLSYHNLVGEIESTMANDPQKATFLAVDHKNLQTFYEQARLKNYAEPELYAVQNWLVRAQGRLLHDLSSAFCENYATIMRGEFTKPLAESRYSGCLLDLLGQIAFNYVFTSKEIVRLEVAADTVLNTLLDRFVPAVINYRTKDAFKKPVDDRLMRLVSLNYRHSYEYFSKAKSESEQLYLRLLLITDFICGMTDNYARDLYQQLQGISYV